MSRREDVLAKAAAEIHANHGVEVRVDAVRSEIAASIPAKRYGRPEEFASVASFLMSDRAGYVTGQMTRVDGGMIRSI